MIDANKLISLIPKAVKWAQQQEKQILENGVPLTANQLEIAKVIAIHNPKIVRLLKVDQIPLPEDVELRIAAQLTNLITPNTIGLTLQYGIFIRQDHWDDNNTIAHELVHTYQYERLGGIYNFLQQYLMECIQVGYPKGDLEQEAIRIGNRIVT